MKFAFLNNHVTLTLTIDELRFIYQAFNEVCHGLRVEHFSSKIGSIDDAISEMQHIANVYKNAEDGATGIIVQIDLSLGSITMCQNVIEVVCDEIEAFEFQSRTGETPERAMEIHADLKKVLDEMNRRGQR